MSSYGLVLPAFWTKGTGKRLRGDKDAQLVAVYLMSCPSRTMVGIYHLSIPQLCNDTGLTFEEATKGLARCSAEGFAFFDPDDELFFVPRLAAIQVGEELTACGRNGRPDRRIAGVRRALAQFKGHQFYAKFLEIYADSYHLQDLRQEAAAKPLTRGYDPVAVVDPDPDPDPVEGVQGETPAEPDARVPCPLDLELPAATVGNLELSLGVPAWATLAITRRFVLKWSATPNERRFRAQWVRSLASAVSGDWGDRDKRARLQAEHDGAAERDPAAVSAANQAKLEREAKFRATPDAVLGDPPKVTPMAARAALDALVGGDRP